ncbi:hypothetical protein GE21DRAFT_1218684, partial [Neurospora crassa]
ILKNSVIISLAGQLSRAEGSGNERRLKVEEIGGGLVLLLAIAELAIEPPAV